jgi:hypothetical protein
MTHFSLLTQLMPIPIPKNKATMNMKHIIFANITNSQCDKKKYFFKIDSFFVIFLTSYLKKILTLKNI